MPERFDSEVDLAMYFGQDPQERLDLLTKACDDCGHLLSAHGKDGCEIERGDSWVEGTNGGALMAMWPCGCQAVTCEPMPIKEGSTLTNDPLQIALAQHYNEQQREIAHAVAVAQERKAYALLKSIEQNYDEAVKHWNECCTRMHATAPRN